MIYCNLRRCKELSECQSCLKAAISISITITIKICIIKYFYYYYCYYV